MPTQIPAATSAIAARQRNAPVSPPVVVFKNPITFGPTNPPTFPIALTRPIPTAAALPPNSIVGRHQNGAKKLITATSASAKLAIRSMGVPNNPAPAQPSAVTIAHAAACNARSPVRSELAPTMSIPNAHNAAIPPVIHPVAALLVCKASRISVGPQKRYA
jgi:hypothetical protein